MELLSISFLNVYHKGGPQIANFVFSYCRSQHTGAPAYIRNYWWCGRPPMGATKPHCYYWYAQWVTHECTAPMAFNDLVEASLAFVGVVVSSAEYLVTRRRPEIYFHL